MKDCKEISLNTKTLWQAKSKNQDQIEISQNELINVEFLANGIPEI